MILQSPWQASLGLGLARLKMGVCGAGCIEFRSRHLPSPWQPPPTHTHVHKPTRKTHSWSLFPGSSPPSPPASLPSPPSMFLLPFAYSLFWACWHLKLELCLQKRHSVAKQAWSRGLQPNLDPKSQADPSVTGFLRHQADPWFRHQDC